jgi:hypothetical protein
MHAHLPGLLLLLFLLLDLFRGKVHWRDFDTSGIGRAKEEPVAKNGRRLVAIAATLQRREPRESLHTHTGTKPPRSPFSQCNPVRNRHIKRGMRADSYLGHRERACVAFELPLQTHPGPIPPSRFPGHKRTSID